MKSPSAPVVWAVFLILFVCLQKIIDQMVIVCGVGLVANLIGTGLYKFGDYIGKKPDKGNNGNADEETDNGEEDNSEQNNESEEVSDGTN